MTSNSSEGRGGVANLFNPDQVVTIHIPQDPAENLPLISSCFSYLDREREPFQASAYLCSILICFFPGLVDDVCDAFTDLGVTVTKVTTASERPISTSLTVPEYLVLLGQAVVVLYKNAQHESNYDRFIEERINRLRAHSGVPSSTFSHNRISFEKAKIIRNTLGSSFGLKKRLLEIMMDASAGGRRSNIVCSYLCDVIACSGMSAIVFIYHALWKPRSPALKEASLQVEVRYLEEAFQKITAVDHPKYFKILSPPDETRVIEACRFPTIIDLAKLLISSRSLSYSVNNSLRLRELKKIHDESVGVPVQDSAGEQACINAV